MSEAVGKIKYVAWIPIRGELKVEIESDVELEGRELRRALRRYLDKEKNSSLGMFETLKNVRPLREVKRLDITEPTSSNI